ncbi:MAG: hypothetical protein HY579_13285 [Nitrospinae bacterium]|nr:hypothetical protein [Nitrospinota bacterium]
MQIKSHHAKHDKSKKHVKQYVGKEADGKLKIDMEQQNKEASEPGINVKDPPAFRASKRDKGRQIFLDPETKPQKG